MLTAQWIAACTFPLPELLLPPMPPWPETQGWRECGLSSRFLPAAPRVRLLPRGASHLRYSRLPAPVPGSSKLIGNPHFSNFILPSGFQGKALPQRCLAYVVPLQLRISFPFILWLVMILLIRAPLQRSSVIYSFFLVWFTPFGMPSRQTSCMRWWFVGHGGKTRELGFSISDMFYLNRGGCLATKVCELKFFGASRWTG